MLPLKKSTHNISSGPVLRDDTVIAVKSVSLESKQGMKEFLTEINMVSNARHTNLVELVGCCVEGGNWMLVYEYLDNNSLTSALLGRKSKCLTLDWPKRAVIFVGTACGLAFLHEDAEPQIVHRDIKGSNVLDKDLIPNIGDSGLARLFPRRKLSGTILMLKERSLGKILKELVLIRILQMEGLIIAFKLKALETEGGSEQSQTEDPKSTGKMVNRRPWKLIRKMINHL